MEPCIEVARRSVWGDTHRQSAGLMVCRAEAISSIRKRQNFLRQMSSTDRADLLRWTLGRNQHLVIIIIGKERSDVVRGLVHRVPKQVIIGGRGHFHECLACAEVNLARVKIKSDLLGWVSGFVRLHLTYATKRD